MKTVLGYILISVIVIALLIGLAFGTGMLGNKYKATIGKESINIDREVFETSKSHVHAMIEDLSKCKLELARTENEVERKAIIAYIQENFSTFDTDFIENYQLKTFLNQIMNGEIK